MGDIEIRGFGRRLLLLWEKERPVTTAPETTFHHAGDFGVASSHLVDDKEVYLGFRPIGRISHE